VTMTDPHADLDVLRRSPLFEVVDHLHPFWAQAHGMLVPIFFRDAASESAQARTLGLCDVSAFPRMGVKGKGAEGWLSSHGLPIPSKIYGHARLENDQGAIIRTGSTEFLIEDGLESSIVANLWKDDDSSLSDVYRFRRHDAVMYLSGERAIDVFAETCGYNFREPDTDLVYTRIAGVSCGILTVVRFPFPVFQIWCDGSFGGYLWEQLYEIGCEHGGKAVGLAAFFSSLKP
jgi:sarcosine oxidase subunit gamma